MFLFVFVFVFVFVMLDIHIYGVLFILYLQKNKSTYLLGSKMSKLGYSDIHIK